MDHQIDVTEGSNRRVGVVEVGEPGTLGQAPADPGRVEQLAGPDRQCLQPEARQELVVPLLPEWAPEVVVIGQHDTGQYRRSEEAAEMVKSGLSKHSFRRRAVQDRRWCR